MEENKLTSEEAKILKHKIDQMTNAKEQIAIILFLVFIMFYGASKDAKFQEESGVCQMIAFACLFGTFILARAAFEEETSPDYEDTSTWSVSKIAKAIRNHRLATQLSCCGSWVFLSVYLSRRYGGMIDLVFGILFALNAVVSLSDKWSMEVLMKKKMEDKKKE